MSKKVSYIISDHSITVNYDGQTHMVARTDALADRLIKAIREQRTDEIPELVSVAKRIEKFSKGNFTVKGGEIFINGIPAPAVLGHKIVRFSNEGLPFQPLVRFAENLQKNPSYRAVNELYQFLEKNDHPITENGNFIAYKKVRPNFMDIHSGLFDNSPGETPEVNRNEVDEDCTQTCSKGLHVANWDYAKFHYGSSSDTMLEVEVNPADVVAIPVDYNQSKMRVCKYKVLGVVDKEHSSDMSLRITDPDYEEDDTDEEIYDRDRDDEYCISCDDEGCDDCQFPAFNDRHVEPVRKTHPLDEDDDYPWDDELI